jgi:hypothetical protein
MNKIILVTLTMLFCATAQSSTQYLELTRNYDSVWRANINDLSKDFTYIADDPYSMYLKDTNQLYKPVSKKPNDLDELIITPPARFAKATDYLDLDVIKKTGYVKDGDYMVFYILKSEADKAIKRNSLQCIYKVKIRSDFGDETYHNLDTFETFYIKYMTRVGYDISTFVKEPKLLGVTKIKNGYTSGSMFVVINNKLITLIIHDCSKQGKGRIIKDLTEWAELLIKANK